MSGPVLDPAVVALAAEVGYRASVAGDGIVVQDTDVTFVGRADGDGQYVLERSSRGSAPRVVVRSSSWVAVELVLVDAGGQRADVRWPGGQYANGPLGVDATTLAHALGHPVARVVDSYRDPDRRPVFD